MGLSVPAESVRDRRPIRCSVNGRQLQAEVPVTRLLVDFLREDLGLTGTKRSCDVQICGVCTVLVDGQPVSSCTYLAFEADGAEIETIEGLAAGEELHPLQAAFIEEFGMQCGYCTPGMIMSAKALLDAEAAPSRERILEYLQGNLCRCTGYEPILAAVQLASERMRDA
jgi:aerobic-type carbon monoxide dehydrogenase small subunit (CoxS/CutS family)